jgi:isocitrate/isopropylmalate dehydrogenase
MSALKLLLLPGDGIGPEIAHASAVALGALNDSFGLDLVIEQMDVGLASLERHGTTLTEAVWQRVRTSAGIILGPLSTYQYPPKEKGGINTSHEFRTQLRLYANVRPSCVRPRAPDGGEAMDLVVVRENTEGFYASRAMHAGSGEFMPDPSSAFALRKITREATQRAAAIAFELARARRRHLTVVHKANVLRISDGLFLESVRELAESFREVTLDEMLVDAMAAALVRQPAQFDVVLTSNMFGDILSNEAAALSGGLGLSPSLNIGPDIAMAQASHGSAPDIAGRNIANPTGLMLSVGMLLEWLGRRHARADLVTAAEALQESVDNVLANPGLRTRDLGGPLGTDEFARAVVAQIGFACSARIPAPAA